MKATFHYSDQKSWEERRFAVLPPARRRILDPAEFRERFRLCAPPRLGKVPRSVRIFCRQMTMGHSVLLELGRPAA
jgi:hypothetical protein